MKNTTPLLAASRTTARSTRYPKTRPARAFDVATHLALDSEAGSVLPTAPHGPLLLTGDCVAMLNTLPANSIDSIVTDPPYGFDMAQWDGQVPGKAVWEACLRVLKPGGHLLAFAGARTQHRMAVRIEDAGFEIRDMLAWLYGSGMPKSHNGAHGGTALKPALEPITLARKPLIGTVKANHLAYGTGGLNIEACRVGSDGPAPARWPANLLHDGGAEVSETLDDASRFFYCAKASKADKEEGLEGLKARLFGMSGGAAAAAKRGEGYDNGDSGMNRTRWVKNFHPTVKPTDLMRYLVRLVTPKGGVVLDPFMGSGSTGKAAVHEGFRFVGIDIHPDYVNLAQARIDHAITQVMSTGG